MTNDTQLQATNDDITPAFFAERLRAAREAMGLDIKDVSAQIRLNQTIIGMMESNHYSVDLPITFIRGYIRSYARFLQIPEQELTDALATIKQKVPVPSSSVATPTEQGFITQLCLTRDEFSRSSNRFMQVFTYLVVFTLMGLVGTWWYGHTPASNGIHEVLAAASSMSQPMATPQATPNANADAPAPVANNAHPGFALPANPMNAAPNANAVPAAVAPANKAPAAALPAAAANAPLVVKPAPMNKPVAPVAANQNNAIPAYAKTNPNGIIHSDNDNVPVTPLFAAKAAKAQVTQNNNVEDDNTDNSD